MILLEPSSSSIVYVIIEFSILLIVCVRQFCWSAGHIAGVIIVASTISAYLITDV